MAHGGGLVLAQLRGADGAADYARSPSLGLLYITDHYATDARKSSTTSAPNCPDHRLVAFVGVGVAANNAEYFDGRRSA
jgi:hypothetical protein